jgi:predicted nucleotidyltransferase
MGRPRIHIDGTTAAQRVAVSTAALLNAGGARKTYRLSPMANAALKNLMQLPDAEETETALIEKLLVTENNRAATNRKIKMQLDLRISNAIKDSLVENLHPERIIIFGSYARGVATEDSDIDIAVIIGNDQPTDINAVARGRSAVRKAIKGSNLDIDFILQSRNKFDEKKKIKGSIQYEIDKEGLVIYERR